MWTTLTLLLQMPTGMNMGVGIFTAWVVGYLAGAGVDAGAVASVRNRIG